MMLCACVWCLLPPTSMLGGAEMHLGAHHQLAHQAEFLVALAFAWPYLRLPAPLLRVTHALTQARHVTT